MLSIVTLVITAYILMFGLMAYAEATRHRRRGLPAVFAALFLSVVAGVLSCVLAYELAERGHWLEAGEGGRRAGQTAHYSGFSGGGGERSTSAVVRSGSSGLGDGGGVSSGPERPSGDAIVSTDPLGAFRNSMRLGFASLLQRSVPDSLATGDIVKDCEACPEMVMVGPGSGVIGAAASGDLATESERPQRTVRFWPGFLISKDPISATSIAAFRLATKRAPSSCHDGQPETGQRDAVCISATEADAFAVWLSAQSGGERYRLLTAAEWEYAARTLGAVQVASTSSDAMAVSPLAGMGTVLAELVTDCWNSSIPPVGQERVAHSSAFVDCQERIVKGAGLTEDRRFARPSARRKIGAESGSAVTGFRVMRDVRRTVSGSTP